MNRLLLTLLALIMAVPLHLCCWLGLMKAADEPVCMACHQFLTPEERQADEQERRESSRHCECCDGTLTRDLAPDLAAIPKADTQTQPLTAWVPFPSLPRVLTQAISPGFGAHERPPPGRHDPLYLSHCALLL